VEGGPCGADLSARRGEEKPRIGIAAGVAARRSAGMSNDLPALPSEPKPGRYRHYKGNEYRVLELARHSETREVLVVYQALYGERGTWVRPAAMFVETVEVGGKRVARFARVGD
jgi:hypothetical protein